jgi:hypothetical protein
VGHLHGRQLLHLYDVEIRSSARVGDDARAVRLAHTPVGTGLVVRGGDLSCEAETYCVGFL